MSGITPITRSRARALRAAMTPQERRLWSQLRELNRMLGLNFRRQAPIGPYVADFAELGRRLVLELDGGGHGGPRDMQRDAWLERQGFAVLRFWNDEMRQNPGGVIDRVLDALDVAPAAHQTPHQPPQPGASPPPCGEGMGVGGPGRATDNGPDRRQS